MTAHATPPRNDLRCWIEFTCEFIEITPHPRAMIEMFEPVRRKPVPPRRAIL